MPTACGGGVGRWGKAMRVLTARWVAGCIAAGSIALMASALVLEYVDRDLLPASLTGWTFDNAPTPPMPRRPE